MPYLARLADVDLDVGELLGRALHTVDGRRWDPGGPPPLGARLLDGDVLVLLRLDRRTARRHRRTLTGPW